MAARMQEGGREEGKICCYLAFVICTIWLVIWVFVGVFVHATGTNVEIVGQAGLTDVLHMQRVGEHCSLGSCQQHRDSAGGDAAALHLV